MSPTPRSPYEVESATGPNPGATRRLIMGALVLVFLVVLLIDVIKRQDHSFDPLQFVRRPANFQTRDDAALLGGWIEEVDNGWEVGKNHQRVRSAFQTIVSDARKSTVRIFRGTQQVAMGTIVDADGYILTKASEVVTKLDGKKDKSRISCQLYDGRRRTAEVVTIMGSHDLAMLKIRAKSITPIENWHRQDPEVGNLVATPHLGEAPLAIGVVSVANRHVDNNGVLGVKLKPEISSSALVTQVVPNSAADLAGIQTDDVVLRVDETPVANSDELIQVIRRRLPGDRVLLDVRRGESEVEVEATLGRRADLDQENVNFQSFIGGELSFRRSGFEKVIQHDTFLLPEHCGGPIVDLEGRVIGINIARAERIASYALPASSIIPLIDSMITGDHASKMVRAGAGPDVENAR